MAKRLKAKISRKTKADVHPGVKLVMVEAVIGYNFKDTIRAWEALQAQRTGFRTGFITRGNVRLAIVGDAVIDLILSEWWYCSGQSPANWSVLQKAKASNATLATFGRKLGLNPCIQAEPDRQQEMSGKSIATAVESIIGAVYLDCGKDIAVVERVMRQMGILG